MNRKRVLSFESLEKIVCLDATISAPVGITTPIEPALSPTDLDQARALVPVLLVGPPAALPAPLPPMAVPTSPVVLGSYGGPAPVQQPIVLAAVPHSPVHPA